MNISADTIKKKQSEGVSSTGHSCLFVPITDTVGLKLYKEKEFAKDAKALQSMGHMDELAPKCWGECEMQIDVQELRTLGKGCVPSSWYRLKGESTVYGYFTEMADVGGLHYEDLEGLRDTMQDVGYNTLDVGGNNVGTLNNGQIVCIDWDPNYLTLTI